MKRCWLVLSLGLLGAAVPALATRPLTIDDADPTPFEQCQLTTGVALEHSGDLQDADIPFGIAYGLVSNLEVNAGFCMERTEVDPGTGNYRHETGCGDLILGIKWQFLGETDWLPRQTLEPAVKIPTANRSRGLGSGRTDYDLTWVASKKLTDRLQVDANLGFTLVGHTKDEPEDDVLHGGLAVEYQLSDSWVWVGEVFGNRDLRGDGRVCALGSTGLRWQIVDGLTADVALGTGLRGEDAPHLTGTIGLTWLFGVNK